MNNQKKPTQLSHLDYLLNDKQALEQCYMDCLYGELPTDVHSLFNEWLRHHPELHKEFKELRSTKDLLQTDEVPLIEGMVLPSFYQRKTPSQMWFKRLKPYMQMAAIIALFFSAAKLMDVQVRWEKSTLSLHFGESKTTNDTIVEDQINTLINKELSSQLPVLSNAIESLIKEELGNAISDQNERYEQLLLNNMKNQELVYQSLIQQISEEVSVQRRNDLLQIMQELNNTRELSSREIAKNREVINGLIQFAGVTVPEQPRTFNEE